MNRVELLYLQNKELSELAAIMHLNGFPVHKKNRRRLAHELRDTYADNTNQLIKLVDVKDFTGTPHQMRQLIFKKHAKPHMQRWNLENPLDPAHYTKTGMCSVNFDALLGLLIDPYTPEDLKGVIKVFWKAEEAKKARGTFVMSKLIDRAIGADGHLRAGWNSLGTDTGRFSCSEPNLMNVPAKLREMYWAGLGHILVHADFSQLELRIMMAVSGDRILEAALATGDVYTADAIAIFGLPKHLIKCPGDGPCKDKCALLDLHIKKMARQAAKQVHLAFQYGAGTAKVYAQVLAENFEAKYSEVAKQHDAMKKRYCGTVDYWFEEQKRVHRDGYSASRICDRRRVYPAEPPITEIANYPIQSTAADVVNTKTIKLCRILRREVPTAKLTCQLHDALDFRVPTRHSSRVERITKEVLEEPVRIGDRMYSFPVELKSGSIWNQLA